AANGLEWLSHGHYQLKGMDEPTEVCEVGALGTAPLTPPADTEKAVRVAGPDSTSTFEVVKQRPTLLLAALILVVVGVLAGLGAMTVRPREPASPPPASAVAVLATEIRGEDDDVELLAYTIRDALTRALTAFEGLAAKSTSEVDAVTGPPTLVAQAVGADDIVESAVTCRGRDCYIDLRRVRGSDGNVERSHSLNVPADELLTAAKATGVGLRQLYPEKSLRPGHGELEVEPEDYAAFVEIKRSFDDRPATSSVPHLLVRLDALRQHSPRFAEAYRFEAGIAFFGYRETKDENLLARALDLIGDAQALAPGDPGLLATRLYIEIHSGRLDDAEQTLTALETLVPGDVRILDYRAQLLEQRGLKAESLELASAALKRRPSWRRLYYHALLAFRQGELGAARESLERLLKLQPDNILGASLLANLELVNGDPKHAAELLSDLVARDPTAARLSELGLAHMLQGDYHASATAFERAVEGAPNDPANVLNLADARWLQGRIGEAEALYRRAAELTPTEPADARSLMRLAQAQAHLGKHREAVAAAQLALRKAPENSWIAFEAALVYAVVGDHTGAVVNAERAIELGFNLRWFSLPWFDALRIRRDFAELVATG
ncbi:MAG: tetratricopeptide repeat protein, partial [bacterium]|nr:tetratricopeptide repeat protein [bacterium]